VRRRCTILLIPSKRADGRDADPPHGEINRDARADVKAGRWGGTAGGENPPKPLEKA